MSPRMPKEEEEESIGEGRFKRDDMVTLLKNADGSQWRVLRAYWLERKGQVYDIQCGHMTMYASSEADLEDVSRSRDR
jgi:hypothetical protein